MKRRYCVLVLTCAVPLACGDTSTSGSELEHAPIRPLELEMRLGSIDDPDLGFTRVSGVLFGGDDRVYVAEGSQQQIRIYDLAGNLLGRIGRDGEGPGEFRSLGSMGFLEDTLFVADGALRRVNMFTSDGDFITSFPWVSHAPEIAPPIFYMPTTPSVILRDGSGVLMQNYGYMPGQVEEISVPWLRIDRTGETMDTIVVQRRQLTRIETLHENGEEFRIGRPISDQPIYELMADRSGTVVVVERPVATSAAVHTIRILKIDVAGDTVFSEDYEYSPTATPSGEAERQAARYVEGYAMMPSAPSVEGVARTFSEHGFIPDYLPPVSTIRTGQDGTVWLQRERTGTDSVTWIRIGEDGDIEGGVRLSEGARIMAARGDLIAVLELDELDVPFLSVFQISPQAE